MATSSDGAGFAYVDPSDMSEFSFISNFKKFVDIVQTPTGNDINLAGVETLRRDIISLQIAESNFYQTHKSLYDFLIGSSSKSNLVISKDTADASFWDCVPTEKRPLSGERWIKIVELKESLKRNIQYYQDNRDTIKYVNENLPKLEHDLRLILDGHYDSGLTTFVHYSWGEITPPNAVGVPELPKRWADYSSSDEDQSLISTVLSMSKKTEAKKAGINLPGDFDTSFPILYRRIVRLCNHWQWEIRKDQAVRLSNQGLIRFIENPDGTVDTSQLADTDRIALVSLYTSIACLFIKPQTMLGQDNTEVAVTYVCSVIAREKLSGENKDRMNVALKNGDGGKAVLNGRFCQLTKTGSSAIKLVMETVEKLTTKFARELRDDSLDKETVEAITGKAFTSIDGMLTNSCRTAVVEVPQIEERTDNRGRTSRVTKKVRKTIKVVPDLSTAKAPLKPIEVARIETLKTVFNNRKAVVEKRFDDLDKNIKPNLLDKPNICHQVTFEAYAKLQGYKVILKERSTRIRDRATELNNGNKPGPGHWAQAKAEVLADCPDIPQPIFDGLTW